jgi:hypothetical protein
MKQSSRNGWLAVVLAVIGIVGALGLGVVGYWRYVNSVPPFTPRLPPLPQPNGYERAVRAIIELSPVNRPPVSVRWPNGTPEELRAQLRALRPQLDAVRASFALEWRTNPPLSFSTPSYEFSSFREFARGFAAESILARRQGDYGTAMQRSLDAVELGVRMPKGGGVLPRLVAAAIFAIGLSLTERVAPDVPANRIPDALARVRRLRKAWPPMSETLESDRISSIAGWTESFQNTSHQPFWDQIRALDPLDMKPSPWELIRLACTPRRIVVANIDDYYRRRIAESKKPIRQRVPVPVPADPWSQVTLFGDGATTWTYEGEPTELALLEVALAVRHYRLQHGRYPVSLHEIGREWLPVVPVDLWGQSIAYRLKAGQPLIYSLGPDGRDDGGRAMDLRFLHRSTTPSGDLVFGQLVRRPQPAPGGSGRS